MANESGRNAMSRIDELPQDQWDAELREHFDPSSASPLEAKARGIMAHAPHMANANTAFMTAAFGGHQLSRRLIELVRLRIAFHNQCRSCMAMRFQSALDDGVTEDLVCSLERPAEAPDLTDREKAALAYADVFATNHFAVNDETFAKLREHFSEAEIVELGVFTAYFTGYGRWLAVLDLVEELPKDLQDKSTKAAPWQTSGSVVVQG
jgi:AhpD family alkylhydroperoxidase